ncbi:MAG: polysaccharide deacetylase family protein [Kiloniellales bacterium]
MSQLVSGLVGTWEEFEAELAAWVAAGQRASLWWRDDDAIEPTPALDRLLALAAGKGLPLALAVIPARATPALVARLARAEGTIAVLQHGFAHRNHAAAGSAKIELGGPRERRAIAEELARGGAMLAALFQGGETGTPPRLPVMVPPWNRIDGDVVALLPELGYRGLSADGPRAAPRPEVGLTQANTHLDIMHWPPPRGFLGEARCLALLTGHLRARRKGRVEATEPTGLLTHHLAHDGPAWDFLERLLARLARHPAVVWRGAGDIFSGTDEARGGHAEP